MARRRKYMLGCFTAMWLVALTAPASAHVDLAESTPRPGAVVDGPLTEIELVFTQEATPSSSGIEVLDGAGVVRRPDVVESDNSITWTLRFDEPVTAGTVAVRWSMHAGDTHPRTGAFTFTLHPLPGSTSEASGDSLLSEEGAGVSTDGPRSEPDHLQPEDTSATGLEEFLAVEDGRSGGSLSSAARALSFVGILIAVGGWIYAGTVLRGDAEDIAHAVYWVRRFALIGLIGTILELGWIAIPQFEGLGSVLSAPSYVAASDAGALGPALRILGAGILMAAASTADARASSRSDPIRTLSGRLPVVAVAGRRSIHDLVVAAERPRRQMEPSGRLGAILAVAVITVSFLIDGHSATSEPRVIAAIATVSHVVAGATWVGGVVLLGLTAIRRRRDGRPAEVLELVVRFSVVASVAVALAGLAGIVLTAMIIEAPSQLWATPWGRALLAKMALVVVAGALGLHNHISLIPAHVNEPTDAIADRNLRYALVVEAIVLLLVVLATSILVTAAST